MSRGHICGGASENIGEEAWVVFGSGEVHIAENTCDYIETILGGTSKTVEGQAEVQYVLGQALG